MPDCLICNDTGWKATADKRVTKCDCQLRERGDKLLTMARIPERYKHCEISNFDVMPVLSITERPRTIERMRTSSGIWTCPPIMRSPGG